LTSDLKLKLLPIPPMKKSRSLVMLILIICGTVIYGLVGFFAVSMCIAAAQGDDTYKQILETVPIKPGSKISYSSRQYRLIS
jgi:hypothetical protein